MKVDSYSFWNGQSNQYCMSKSHPLFLILITDPSGFVLPTSHNEEMIKMVNWWCIWLMFWQIKVWWGNSHVDIPQCFLQACFMLVDKQTHKDMSFTHWLILIWYSGKRKSRWSYLVFVVFFFLNIHQRSWCKKRRK